MKKYLYFFLLASLLVVSCKSDDEVNESSKKTTPKAAVYDQDDDNTTQEINDAYRYKLPVIFHVFYSDATKSTQYVPQSRLAKILSNVNDLYKGNIYGQSEDINVEFQMAKTDEKGNTLKTPGVEYVKWTGAYPISYTTIMTDNNRIYTKYLWDPNEYINVFVYNFATENDDEGITLGISHMPYVVKNAKALQGLSIIEQTTLTKQNLNYAYCSSINSLYINEESTRYSKDKGKDTYYYSSSDVNVTLAHELGHYLGLHHTFTQRTQDESYEMIDSCADTDFCKDTPTYNRIAYQQYMQRYLEETPKEKWNLNDLLTRTNCNGSRFESENILDYSMSSSFRFTADQKYRMRQVLYYSPLIPGPKLQPGTTKRLIPTLARGASNKPLNLPIRYDK
ncbi:MAG TPA: zinc-dependent metalloproteinase lipoprotein [Prevotella sp.]